MKVPDLFVGKRLFVGCDNPIAIGLGVGPTEIRGSGFIEGPLIVGTPLSYTTGPNVTEATLMVARCTNEEALPPPPSIFKVSTRGLSPTPIDVMLGDPTGHVGITVNSTLISIFNDTNVSIVSPFTTGTGQLTWVGSKTFVGAETITSVKAQVGAEARTGNKCTNAVQKFNGVVDIEGLCKANVFLGDISACSGKKDFDIPHPTKDGWRLRHVCIEGPTADVYVRGKLKDSNIIILPNYWRGLVDPETITINITPIGHYQELFVEKIEWGSKVIVKNNASSSINCYYTITGERIDVDKNIPEYEGTYDDYPGNNDEYMNTVRFLPVRD